MVSLSIVIPAYNVDKYISKCLDSLVNQTTDKKYEILIIDDGSFDNTPQICDDYSERYRYVKTFHTKNGGVSIARNLGIDNASGLYISFVDADDWVTPDYVETILTQIRDNDLLFFSHNRYFADGSIVGQYHSDVECSTVQEIEDFLLQLKAGYSQYEYFGYTWNKCFKADVLNNIRFIEGLKVREDEVFTSTYCRHINSLKFLQKGLYFYRELPIGLTYAGKSKSEWMLLCRKLDEATDGIGNKNLLYWEKIRILKFYLNYMERPSWSEFKEIHSFYYRFFVDGDFNHECRSGVFLKLPRLLSYMLYCIFKKIKHYSNF